MKDKRIEGILLVALLVFTIAFLGFFASKEPAITGFVAYEEAINIKNWTFDDTNDYVYDDSLIKISGGIAEIVSTTTYTYWNTSTETNYFVTSALYNPTDKTKNVNSLDNKKYEVDKEKIFDILFAENLDNGDIISFYLEGENEAAIYLCKRGSVCTAPSYGSANFNGSKGWYNITLSNLESPTKIISIVSLKMIKFNYITSTKGDITKALYNPSEQISKIEAIDNKKIQIYKNNLFNVIFDSKISNGDVISLYLKSGSESDIYLCDYGEFCPSGYGSVNFNGNEGWYNLTITNLDEPKDSFNINSSKNIKLDYIKAVHIDITTHSSENISYPESASIETNDIDINGLSSFLNFYKNDLLDNQNIVYYYSTDSGNNWHNIPDDGDLSSIDTTNQKIRIKADFSSDGSATPTIYDFSVKYETQICNEDWNLTYGECFSSNTKLKYYIDKNECGTTNDLPTGNGTYESCVYIPPCNEDWNATYGVCLPNSTKLKYYLDKNDCGTITNLPADNGTYETCDYTAPCNENWNTTYGTCLNNNTRLKYYIDKNECGTINDLPIDNGTYEVCNYCSPDWSCISYGECQLNNFKKCTAVEDNNLCYNLTNLISDAYFGDYNEFNLSCVYNKTGTGFSNLSISAVANEKLIINKTNSIDTILELNASNDIENNFVSITKYSENKKNTSPSLSALNKYLDIEANDSLKNSINSVKIKIYYTDEEINNANLDENTLKIYYFNEINNQWQVLNSTVNTTENYIEVTIDHLSTFGIFGEEIAGEISGTSESSSSGGSSGGGGGGSTRRIPKTAAKPVETETLPEKEETVKEKEVEMPKEAKEECDYKISVSLPEYVSFVESNHIKGVVNNIGNCKIENLNIEVSAELKDIST